MDATAAGVMEPIGQGWSQVVDLCVAFALSSIVGAERQWRGKSAGCSTPITAGHSACCFRSAPGAAGACWAWWSTNIRASVGSMSYSTATTTPA